MNDHRQQRKINWSSLIGWLIFLLVIAGGPLLNALQNAFGGAVRIPAGALPLIVLGLVVLSALVSVLRGLGGRDGSSRPSGPARSPFQPAPLPQSPTMQTYRAPVSGEDLSRHAPRFEPIISPLGLAFGVIGLLMLIAMALYVFSAPVPVP